MARETSESDIAWGHFLSQHQRAANAENFVRPFYIPMNSVAIAADDILTALDYTKADGARLDLIGSIVGASRYLPQGITLSFFGFVSQPSGRGFGLARMRHQNEETTQAYTANDIEYRTIIQSKIRLNNGHGTAEEIADAAKIAFNAPVVSARDAGPAAVEIWIGRIPGANEGIGRIIPDYIPRAAGVKLSIKFWDAALSFGFSNNGHFGFGVGVMSRSL